MSLYGWYSWPSIFLGFIGGYLLDNIFGLRFGTALACLFVVIGQVFLSIGTASWAYGMLHTPDQGFTDHKRNQASPDPEVDLWSPHVIVKSFERIVFGNNRAVLFWSIYFWLWWRDFVCCSKRIHRTMVWSKKSQFCSWFTIIIRPYRLIFTDKSFTRVTKKWT